MLFLWGRGIWEGTNSDIDQANLSVFLAKGENLSPINSTNASSTECSSETNKEKMTKRQKKKAKKSGVSTGTPLKLKEFEVFTTEDVNFISEAIHLRVIESKVRTILFFSVFTK